MDDWGADGAADQEQAWLGWMPLDVFDGLVVDEDGGKA